MNLKKFGKIQSSVCEKMEEKVAKMHFPQLSNKIKKKHKKPERKNIKFSKQ